MSKFGNKRTSFGEIVDPNKKFHMYDQEEQNFPFKLSDVFGYVTRIISEGCYQVMAPEKPKITTMKSKFLSKKSVELGMLGKNRSSMRSNHIKSPQFDEIDNFLGVSSGKKVQNFSE